MRLLLPLFAGLLACARGPVRSESDAIEIAKSWAFEHPSVRTAYEVRECGYRAERRGDSWAVETFRKPDDTTISVDCYCMDTYFVEARSGRLLCLICSGGFSIHGIASPEACQRFLPPR